MKYLFLAILMLVGCDTNSSKKIEEQQAEIYRLKEENKRLNALIYFSSSQIINNKYQNADCSEMDDNRLINEFKNYLSDSHFSYSSFKLKNEGVKIESLITDNVEVRKLVKGNENLFVCITKKFNKIIFQTFNSKIIVKRIEYQTVEETMSRKIGDPQVEINVE